MSVFFAMIGSGDDRIPAFFLTRRAAPDYAVEISDSRHRDLLEAQSQGRRITVDARGRPVIDRCAAPDAGAIRPQLVAAIHREAARRIREISPEWRQINDLREPSEAGAVRFARIDAIRAASNEIEDVAEGHPPHELVNFPVSTHPLWPEFD